jgi:hypothetical protein
MGRFDSLLQSTDDLRVEAFAQDPFCADVALRSPAETYAIAQERGFDQLPVLERDRKIRRLVPTRMLVRHQGWDTAEGDMEPITADLLVARDAPAFSLLERFEQAPALFTLGRDGIDGIVTVYDLNQPPAHVLGFGLALIVESGVSDLLRDHLGEDPEEALASAAAILGTKAPGIEYWKKARKADADVHLASKLGFGEKLRILPSHGLTSSLIASVTRAMSS